MPGQRQLRSAPPAVACPAPWPVALRSPLVLLPAAEQTRPLASWRTAYQIQPTEDGEPPRLAPAPMRLLFVCQRHAMLSPMAEALARHAYRRLNIYVQSAGLQAGGASPKTVAALAEVGIGIDPRVATCVRNVDLGSFDLLVALGVETLDHQPHQMTLRWDEAAFERLDEASTMTRVRQARDGLLQRIRALGAILSTTNRA